jgi:diguanylate cyclase
MATIINVFVNLFTHIVRLIDGYPPARYVIAAAIPACAGISTTMLAKTAVLPSNTFTELAAYIGCSMMTLLYAQAISYRMNMDRDLREDAQRQLTEQLDIKVRERTEELEMAYATLQQVSITDGLTNTFNRRHFDETLEKEYQRALRESIPLSVLMLDIDHFKGVNDHHGHPFGDLCLQVVSRRIQDCVYRSSDFVARYGGEEFVILLPDTNLQAALKIAERIRQSVAADPVQQNSTTLTVTASIGVANTVPSQPQQQDHLIKLADDYLYQAKADGRNQVVGCIQ